MACFFINGQLLSRYCVKNGISYSKCYYWLDKYGLSVEEAIKRAKEPAKKYNLKWEFNGGSIYEYCKKHKLLYNSIVRDIKRGMGVKKAIARGEKFRHKRGFPAKYEYNGKSFRSVCKDLGINYQSAHHWLKIGNSVEYVIERFKNV